MSKVDFEFALGSAKEYLEVRRTLHPNEQPILDSWREGLDLYQNLVIASPSHKFAQAETINVREIVDRLHESRPLHEIQIDLGNLEHGVRMYLQADPHGPALPPPKIIPPKGKIGG